MVSGYVTMALINQMWKLNDLAKFLNWDIIEPHRATSS